MQKKYLETRTTAHLNFVVSLFYEGIHNLSHNKICFVAYLCVVVLLLIYHLFKLVTNINFFTASVTFLWYY